SSANPPTWSKCSWLWRRSFTSDSAKPSASILAAIGAAPSAVPPSISTWPSSPVTSSAVIPHVPTYQVLPWTRNGGPALSQSSQSAQASTQRAWSAAEPCAATCGTAPPPAMSRAAAVRSLANIACPIGIDDGAGHARRGVKSAKRGNGCDFLRRGDAAEWNVGEQPRTAAALQIIAGHDRVGEAGRNGEAENALPGVGAGDRLVQRQHAAFRGGIVPVIGRIAAVAGAAGDVDQAAFPVVLQPMAHRETADLGRCGEIDPQRVLPAVEPSNVGRGERICGKDAGVVDDGIDPSASAVERFLPQDLRCARLGKVGRDRVSVGGASGVADHPCAAPAQRLGGGLADPAARPGDENGGHG